ncbi:hypothetical protein ACHAWF_000180, partial [Thalassiosira exigua]
FQSSCEGRVKPAARYLSSLLSPLPRSKQRKQLVRISTKHPALLQLDVESNLRLTARFLGDSFDLTEKELAAVIAATPAVLGLSIKRNLEPTMRFLWEITEVGGLMQKGDYDGSGGKEESKSSLRKCVLKHPQILALSLRNLSAKKDYFDEIDGGDGSHATDIESTKGTSTLAARILFGAPSVYSLSLEENIVPKVDYLSRLWCSGSDGDDCAGRSSLVENLREYPQILTLSMEGNIVP